MAKSLREPPPSSSVARLLDPQAASRAIAVPRLFDPEHHAAASRPDAHTCAPTEESVVIIKRELILNPATDETLSELIQAYRRATGARLGASHVVRAILAGVAHSLPALQREIQRLGELKLPSNGRGFCRQRTRFEQKLAAAFVAGMRAAAVLEVDE